MEQEENSKLPTQDYKMIIDFVMKYPVVLIGGGLLLAAIGFGIRLFTKNESKIINIKK